MTLLSSVATATRGTPHLRTGSAPVRGPVGANSVSTLTPQLEHTLVIGVIVALAVTCLVLLAFTVYVNQWHHRVLSMMRRGGRGVGIPPLRHAEEDQEHAAPRPVDEPRPLPVTLETSEILRILDSTPVGSATPDQGWQSLIEDVPGVGRIEWDAQTLRAFAYQPDVLYRLAFHRWRLQQGALSEFDLTSHAAELEQSGERPRDTNRTSRRVTPSLQGLHREPRSQPPTQQSAHAED